MDLPELLVDRDADVPLGTQLAWRLRTLVATGRLAPGDRLPGVRELAASAGVNVNTARTVYARLEEQGLIASEHGRGTFVAPGAAAGAGLAQVAADAAASAREAGVDLRELATALYAGADLVGFEPPRDAAAAERPAEEERAGGAPAEPAGDPTRRAGEPARRVGGRAGGGGPAAQTGGAAGGAGAGTTPPGGETAARRVLRAQIAELERELVQLERGAQLPARPRPAASRILTAAELREVRDELVERLAHVRDRRAEERRRAYAQRAAALSPAPVPRTWRHAGVWTGHRRPGVVWTGR